MRIKVLLVAIFLLSCLHSHSQWVQTNGPWGGDVRAFASSGNDLFAGTTGSWVWYSSNNGNTWTPKSLPTPLQIRVTDIIFKGSTLFVSSDSYVYRSTDNGNSWTWLHNGLNNGPLTSMEISGNDIFAATWGGGIYRSSDNGDTWTLVNSGLGGLEVTSLILKGTTLYAATYYNGIYKSVNNGNTWSPDSVGLNGALVTSLTVVSNILCAGTDLGVYRSLGASWFIANNGLTHTATASLTSSGSNLIAGSWDGYISYSNDAGISWNSSNQRLSLEDVNSLAVHNNFVFAGTGTHGIYRSADFGISWIEANNNLINSYVASLATLDSTLIAGMQWSGIQISNDEGNNWNNMSSGLTHLSVATLTVSDTTIFAGTYDGLFRSDDKGNSWVPSDNGINATYNNIKGVEQNGNYLFTAVYGSGVYRSQNNGGSWVLKSNGLTNNLLTSLVTIDTCMLVGTFTGLFLSTDYGDSWVPANNGIVGNLNIKSLFAHGNSVYASTTSATYRSLDNGNTWLPVGNGVPIGVNCWAGIGTNLFAGNSFGVYRSTDNGIFWSTQNDGFPVVLIDCKSLAIMDSVVCAGTSIMGVFKNADLICANTFQTINPVACGTYNSPSGAYTWSVSGTYNDTILNIAGCDSIITINLTILTAPLVTITASGALTFCQGDSVVLSATPGMVMYQWYRRNNAISGATNINFTATVGGSYKCIAQNAAMCSDTSNFISVSVPCVPIDPNQQRNLVNDKSGFNALSIYPNPGTGIFTVAAAAGNLEIYNSIGRLILSMETFNEETKLDLSGFSDGIYFVHLQTSSSIYSGKIVLVR